MVMFVFESREQGLVYLWMSGTVEWEGLHVGGIQLTTGEYVRIDVTEWSSPDPSAGASSKKFRIVIYNSHPGDSSLSLRSIEINS